MRIAYRVGWLVGKVAAWVESLKVLGNLTDGFNEGYYEVPEYDPSVLRRVALPDQILKVPSKQQTQ